MNKVKITKKEKNYLEERHVWEWAIYSHTAIDGSTQRSSKTAIEFLKEGRFDKYIEFLRINC